MNIPRLCNETRTQYMTRCARESKIETSDSENEVDIKLQEPSVFAEAGPSNPSENDTSGFYDLDKRDASSPSTKKMHISSGSEGEDFDSDDSIRDRNYIPSEEESDSEMDRNENNNNENIPKISRKRKRLTRKRFRDPQLWERNQRKLYRNSGHEYTNSKGKTISSRKMKPVCSDKCRLKCFSKITESKRKEIFDYYWQIGNIDSQRTFINSCMSEITPMYRNTKPGSTRSKNVKYTFQIDNSSLQVCKTFFKNTLGINNRVIWTTTKKKDENGMIARDQRGKHNKQRKISEIVRNDILEHIKSFPTVESHYCRSRTNKIYLEGSLNIKIMYNLYVEHCKSNNKEFAKHGVYAQILNTETNVGFHIPKKDQCSLCENYKNANDEAKDSLKEKFERHLKEKQLSREEKMRDVECETTEVYCFDLESVLPTPCGDVNSFYYKRKLATFNFTIFDIKNKEGSCFLWHEGIAKRGANEIASCVYKFIGGHQKENLIFYSDNCVGQNKNKFLFGMYLYAVQKFEPIKSISHKFLIVGHTQNEGDSMHATIEREKKRVLKSGPIYVPSQWCMVIRNAKKQSPPYSVDEISTNDVFDFKNFVQSIGNNFTLNDEKEKVNWKDVKIVRVEKDQPFTIFYKTSYEQLDYKKIMVRKSIRTKLISSIGDLKISKAYSKPPTISVGKKKHLLEMCKENAIKEVYWPFYNSLQAASVSEQESSDEDV